AIECAPMFARLKAVWHDPVWSKIIAAGVLAAVAAAWTFRAAIADAFRSTLRGVGGWLAVTGGWLVAPAEVSHLLLLLMLLAIARLAVVSRKRSKRMD